MRAVQSTSSEVIPSLPEQIGETTIMLSTLDQDDGLQVSGSFALNEQLASSQEVQPATAVNLGAEVAVEGVHTGQSESPAATASQAGHEPQQSSAQDEQQSPRVAKKIYGGVKTTLQRIVDVPGVFPPLKSTAAGLLVICDTIDVSVSLNKRISLLPIYVQAYGENKEEFDGLLKRVEVLSQIIASCPPNISQEVKDRFDGLSR
jgi:hypothetical protein